MTGNTALAKLVTDFTEQIEALIDRTVAERFDRALAQFRSAVVAPQVERPTTARAQRAARVARPSPPRSAPPASAPRPLAELPKPKTATVIPPEVPITRLPPGPEPRQSTYSKLRAQCRLPGCLTRNSGPRYDLFCRDHYAALNREERERYKAQWKAQHAPVRPAAPAA